MIHKLDSLLLRGAQWTVDRIGGDYLGQRIALHLNHAATIGALAAYAADYRWSGFMLGFICFIWLTQALWTHSRVKEAMRALHRGFANPLAERDYPLRPVCVLLLFIQPGTWDHEMFYLLQLACLATFYALFYFAATENPPPNKAKQTADVPLADAATNRA